MKLFLQFLFFSIFFVVSIQAKEETLDFNVEYSKAIVLIKKNDLKNGYHILESLFNQTESIKRKIELAHILAFVSAKNLTGTPLSYAQFVWSNDKEMDQGLKYQVAKKLADQAFQAGHLSLARIFYQKALSYTELAKADQGYLMYNLGWVLVNERKYSEAIHLFIDGLKQDPNSPWASSLLEVTGRFTLEHLFYNNKDLFSLYTPTVEQQEHYAKGLMKSLTLFKGIQRQKMLKKLENNPSYLALIDQLAINELAPINLCQQTQFLTANTGNKFVLAKLRKCLDIYERSKNAAALFKSLQKVIGRFAQSTQKENLRAVTYTKQGDLNMACYSFGQSYLLAQEDLPSIIDAINGLSISCEHTPQNIQLIITKLQNDFQQLPQYHTELTQAILQLSSNIHLASEIDPLLNNSMANADKNIFINRLLALKDHPKEAIDYIKEKQLSLSEKNVHAIYTQSLKTLMHTTPKIVFERLSQDYPLAKLTEIDTVQLWLALHGAAPDLFTKETTALVFNQFSALNQKSDTQGRHQNELYIILFNQDYLSLIRNWGLFEKDVNSDIALLNRMTQNQAVLDESLQLKTKSEFIQLLKDIKSYQKTSEPKVINSKSLVKKLTAYKAIKKMQQLKKIERLISSIFDKKNISMSKLAGVISKISKERKKVQSFDSQGAWYEKNLYAFFDQIISATQDQLTNAISSKKVAPENADQTTQVIQILDKWKLLSEKVGTL